MDNEHIRRKLVDHRVKDPAGLSRYEQRMVEEDVKLQAEMQLNLVIETNRPEAPDAPAVSRQIEKALRRAERMSTRWDSAAMWGGRWRYVAAAVAVLAVLAAITLSPWRLDLAEQRVSLSRREAWAEISGHLLEYTLVSVQYIGASVGDSRNESLRQMQERVEDWSARTAAGHGPGAAGELARLFISHVEPDPAAGVYRAVIMVGLFDDDPALAEDLAAELSGINGLDRPVTTPERWYMNTRYPDRYFIGKRVIIDGVEYSYPLAINEASLPALATLLKQAPRENVLYVALGDDEELQRFRLSGLVSVTRQTDGTTLVSTIDPGFEFGELGLPVWVESFAISVRPNEQVFVRDPAMMVAKVAADMNAVEYASDKPAGLGVPEGAAVSVPGDPASWEQRAAVKVRKEDLTKAVKVYLGANRGDWGAGESALVINSVELDGIPTKFYFGNASLSTPAGANDEGAVFRTDTGQTLMARATGPFLSLAYHFFDRQRFAGLHQSDVRREFGPGDFERGRLLSEQVDRVIDSFKAANGITLANADALPGKRELVYNGLITGVLVQTGYTEGPEFEALRKALTGTELPQPVVVYSIPIGTNEDGNRLPGQTERLAGLTPVLVFHLSYEERCQVCLDTDFSEIFTDAERAGSRLMLQDLREQVRQWLRDQDPGTGAGVIETIAGGAVVRIAVQCNRTDEETVNSLATALKVENPPTSYYLERIPQV